METTGCALVVGAGGGIGTEIALALTANGVSAIACADVKIDSAEGTKQKCESLDRANQSPVKAYALQVDVTDEASVQSLVDSAYTSLGRIDYFVNAAGCGNPGQDPINSTPFETYKALDAVHNLGGFLTLRAILQKMQQQDPVPIRAAGRDASETNNPRSTSRGSIVVLASLASVGGYLGVAPYVASKHAVVGLVQNAALENASKGIRVNAVSPSYVSGPMMNAFLDASPDVKKDMLGDLPFGRLAEPTEIADAIVFLCSGSSSYINGHNMVVDGGASVALAKGRY